MIYGRLDRLDRYKGLSARLDKALDFLKTQNLTALPAGKTVLDGEALFVNRFDYKTAQESVTEAHRAYTDIHIVLEGEERVGVADVALLRQTESREEEDFIGFEGAFGSVCTLRPGDFLIVFPEDAHCPKLCASGPAEVKKIVVKVLDG